jgi:hypothetical protein
MKLENTLIPNPPLKKRRTNGKAKGSGFESTIAKLFTEKFAPLQFRRSQSSGAILGGQNQIFLHRFSDAAKTLFIGDIVPTNEADIDRAEGWQFKFTIECKFYKEADGFASLFKNPQVKGWFEQAMTDADKLPEKEGILIFKFNHTAVFAAVKPSIKLPDNITASMLLYYKRAGKTQEFIIVHLNELLEHPDWWKQVKNPPNTTISK